MSIPNRPGDARGRPEEVSPLRSTSWMAIGGGFNPLKARTYLSLVLGVIFLLCTASYALAEDDIRTQVIEGKPYACFGQVEALQLLKLRFKVPNLELEIDQYKELIGIYDQKSEIFSGINENLISQRKVYIEEVVSLRTMLDKSNSFWKSPILWFAIGAVVGVGITIGIVEAVKQ